MTRTIASAPGKLILLGEYAVLEGATALVAAVDRRASATVRRAVGETALEIDGGEIHVAAPDLGIDARGWRTADGTVHTLVDAWQGHRLNSPNDVVVTSDGAIWFTDPPYGIIQPHEGHPGEREYGAHHVFRFDERTGDIRPVVTDIKEPNGLAFSPDESVLYVSDTSRALRTDGTGNHHIVGYLKLLIDGELGDLTTPQLKSLRAMSDCVHRLRRLIDSLLDVTALETGRMRFAQREYDLAELVQKASKQPAFDDGRIHLVADLPKRGTLMGTGRYLKEANPDIQVIAVEPDNPMHGIEGLKHMASSIKPGIYHEQAHDAKIPASTEDAYDMQERLAREEGIFVGFSAGAAVWASLKLADQLEAEGRHAVIVTILCDRGDRYLTQLATMAL